MSITNKEVRLLKDDLQVNQRQIKVLDVGSDLCEFGLSLCNEIKQIQKLVCIDDFQGRKWSKILGAAYSALENDIGLLNFPSNVAKDMVSFRRLNIQEFANKSDDKFDLILLRQVIHLYSLKDDRLEILKSATEVLSQKGKMFLRVANEDHPYKEDPQRKAYTSEELKQELDEFGFSLISPIIKDEQSYICLIAQKTRSLGFVLSLISCMLTTIRSIIRD